MKRGPVRKHVRHLEHRASIMWSTASQDDDFSSWQLIGNWLYGYAMALEVMKEYEARDIALFLQKIAKTLSMLKPGEDIEVQSTFSGMGGGL